MERHTYTELAGMDEEALRTTYKSIAQAHKPLKKYHFRTTVANLLKQLCESGYCAESASGGGHGSTLPLPAAKKVKAANSGPQNLVGLRTKLNETLQALNTHSLHAEAAALEVKIAQAEEVGVTVAGDATKLSDLEREFAGMDESVKGYKAYGIKLVEDIKGIGLPDAAVTLYALACCRCDGRLLTHAVVPRSQGIWRGNGIIKAPIACEESQPAPRTASVPLMGPGSQVIQQFALVPLLPFKNPSTESQKAKNNLFYQNKKLFIEHFQVTLERQYLESNLKHAQDARDAARAALTAKRAAVAQMKKDVESALDGLQERQRAINEASGTPAARRGRPAAAVSIDDAVDQATQDFDITDSEDSE